MEKFFYRVKFGDTLFKITQKFNCSVFVAIKENNLCKEVCEGDLLILSKCKKPHLVCVQDTFESIAQQYNLSQQTLKQINANPPYLFYGMVIETQQEN